MTGLESTSVDKLPENLLHGLFSLAPEGELPVPIHTKSGFSHILAPPYYPRTGGGNTGFPLKNVSPLITITPYHLLSSLTMKLERPGVVCDRSREQNAQPAKTSQKIVFSRLGNPRNNLTPCLARSKIVGHSQKTTNTRAARSAKLNVACSKTLSKVHAVGARDLRAPQHQKKEQNIKTAWSRRHDKMPVAETSMLHVTLRYHTKKGSCGAQRRRKKKRTAPSPTREHARTSLARIGRGRHETSKLCESNTGTIAPKHKAPDGKPQKAHHTTKHPPERTRAPSSQEVCPCMHVM